jgi:aminoglycoside phosphotransferase family enzyme/predicted kinase
MTMLEESSGAPHSPSLPAIVEAMLRPAFYPEHPEKVELIQTHISYVFVGGAFVYKLKKAVCFSFIDCTDLGQRRHLCGEEIRLNRRLAPDVYLGMYPIFRVGPDFVLGDKSAEHHLAVDYVLKMRRLPAARMLDRMLARREVDRATIGALASRMVNFYQTASSAHASRYGSASELWRLIIGELIEMERFVGLTLTAEELPTIENYCRGFITSHWEMFNARVEAGRVREGHGDLRCEHICIEDGKISIFDCVEFSERLRTCDIASEVAFLAMDLDRLGEQDLADELVGAVAESTQDEELPLLMPVYKCYRAVIRGVVESLRSRQTEIEDRDRKAAIALAGKYFSLACSYAIDAAPAIMVVCGLSGTGKSTLARALQHRFGFALISSDRTRKKLASIPAESSAAAAYKAGLYADAITESTYEAMLDDAVHLLSDATGVILDATFQDPAHRKAALDVASRVKVPILFIECRADDAEIRRRLIERQKTRSNPSDATVEIYLRQREDFVALSEIPAASHLIVDTARPLSEIVTEAKNAMKRLDH